MQRHAADILQRSHRFYKPTGHPSRFPHTQGVWKCEEGPILVDFIFIIPHVVSTGLAFQTC